MSSGRHCCVPGCKESGSMHPVLHGFPNPVFDRERFNTWLYAIGCHDILGLKNEQILRHRVCRAHFEDKYLCRNNRLSNIAVPTLKMPSAVLHAFPNPSSESDKFQTWAVNAGLVGEDKNHIFRNRRICRRHFEKKYHYPKNRLSKLAVPTLYLLAPAPAAPTPNKTAQGQKDDNDNDDESLPMLIDERDETPTSPIEKTIVEENIAPETAACEQVPPASQSTADTDSQNIPQTPHQAKKITQKTLDFVKIHNFKLKFKNILHNTKFCGICLENDESMNTVDEDLEIVVHERTYAKTLQCLVDIVFNEANYSLASSYVCNNCLDKLIQSYIFIETAIETSKSLDDYVNELSGISNDIFNQLPESKIEIKNVVIVLENNNNDSLETKDETNETFEDNNESNVIRNKFKCVRCLTMLPTHRDLKIHKMKCNKQIFRCRTCSKLFRNKERLTAHHKLHLKVKCKFCHEIVLKKELLHHFKMNHEDTLIKCLKCELFYSLKMYQSHTKVCQQIIEDKQQCLMCLKTFTEIEFTSHICKHSCPECTVVPCMHYVYLKYYREQILNNADKIKCFYCDYVCKEKELLIEHVNRDHFTHHPYICNKCGKQFYSKVSLRTHIVRYHENCFVCQFCDSEFSNIDKYESHVASCEDIKRDFACENCPASFDSYGSLTNHVERRHSADVFSCDLCNKHFLTDSKRKVHMVKVHGDLEIKNRVQNVQCIVCQETFDNKKRLGQHMKSHDANVTYPCMICNTVHLTWGQFREHNQKHKKKSFTTCHVCGKEVRQAFLTKHLITHSTATEVCETCGKSFRSISLLKYHQRVHLERVACPTCGKMINPARQRRHLRKHAMEENPEKKKQPKSKRKLRE